ncbi:MAG: hypothetical protein HOV94_39135 [Saccharothrix sp.]|nr:hypothetical protein [Saccharothrix sp.]
MTATARRTTRRRRSRAYREALRHARDPWSPLPARQVWRHEYSRAREHAADVAAGRVCGVCGRPAGEDFPRCLSCPPDEPAGQTLYGTGDAAGSGSFWSLPDDQRARLLAEADAAELAAVQHDRRILARHENQE